MQALDQPNEYRIPPQPILAGDGDNFDDSPPGARQCCQQCFDDGFRDGAASVRKAPLITINWSTLTVGIINILGSVALIYAAFWFGELRGMNSDGRLNITFSDGQSVPEKTSAAPVFRGLNGTTVTIVPKD